MHESQAQLEAEYRASWELVQRVGLQALNCGYLRCAGQPFHHYQQDLIWRLLERSSIGPESTVLDVGCGIGGPTTWIFERFGPRLAIGVEYVASTVRTASELWAGRSPRPHFVQADAHRLPIEAGSVDVILNCESALHYHDKHAFLRQCRRVLKPGGHLCLCDITTRAPRLWGLLTRPARPRVYLWSASQYRSAFGVAGFEVLDHEEASARVAAALRAGAREILTSDFPDVPDIRRRAWFLRTLEFLLRHRALTYDLFTARAGQP
ncbi:MAG: class I SAM-dependent methyltransferase [Planctomycetota bacterium]|jgi:ubiquinone/menaquinone biosynthesis C-methylase UbiE